MDRLVVRSVFLDISKVFHKVRHGGVIFKLNQNGICCDLFYIPRIFLSNRKQRVVLNGQVSTWTSVNAEIPQGFILGPFLFLIYINDLSENSSPNVKLFADNTALFSVIYDMNLSASELNNDLKISTIGLFSGE